MSAGVTDPARLDREIALVLSQIADGAPPLEMARHLGNLARRMNRIGRPDLAERCFDRAAMLAPEEPTMLRSLGLAEFGAGRWAEGLAMYDRARWRLQEFQKYHRAFPQPEWKGQDVAGKRLLLWAEQGLGDQIMQARVVAPLMASGAQVTVESDMRLHPILERTVPGVQCAMQTVELPEELVGGGFDYQGSLFSAWRWADLAVSPGRYLEPDPGFAAATRRAWDKQGWGLNVGISWRSVARALGGDRTLNHEMLVPLLRQPDLTFHSLQYDADAEEIATISRLAGRPLWRAGNVDAKLDLDRLASLISALDLVISTDNTTVHIAGAVGTPCWVMLPVGSDWRWGGVGERTPLYESMRLFRNHWVGWGGVLVDVIEALGRWRSERG